MDRIVFLGTPRAAVPALEALGDRVGLVVTQPNRPRGRSGAPQPPPVRTAAESLGIAVSQPESREELGAILSEGHFDLGVVVAFGMILTPTMLASTPGGFLNVHFSLLPRWRGAAPVQRALLAGDREIGVSLMEMDAGLDTGPVIASEKTLIGSEETTPDLTTRLAELGAGLLAENLDAYLAGNVEAVPQREEGVTYAPKVDAAEEKLDPADTAVNIVRRVRAMHPRAYFEYGEGRLRVLKAEVAMGTLPEGKLAVMGDRLICGCGSGMVVLNEVQPSGKRAMVGVDWARGRRGAFGSVT